MSKHECVVRDVSGNVVQRSRNLRGIREYVGKHLVKTLAVDEIADGGKLCILFEDGASYETNFADFGVLKGFVRRWRNVYGTTLFVNGRTAGTVTFDNSWLA